MQGVRNVRARRRTYTGSQRRSFLVVAEGNVLRSTYYVGRLLVVGCSRLRRVEFPLLEQNRIESS